MQILVCEVAALPIEPCPKRRFMEKRVPKLCKFTSPRDGKPVYVNPEQVSVVYTHKGEPPDTIIGFGKDFMLGVQESLEETVRILEEAGFARGERK
jgi:hypothetical protein